MITKQDIHAMLEGFGIRHDDTVTIHAALRAAGPIENGADGLIDGLVSYLNEGLLLVPTHTWAVVTKDDPVFDVRSTVPNIGALARVAAFRKDAVRTLHPTHSLALFGKEAWAYAQGEEMSTTPTPVGGCLSRLYERGGKVLLLGIGHERNTYLHAVDERMAIGNRIRQEGFPVTIIDWDGKEIHNPDYHPHETRGIPKSLSEYFRNYDRALEKTGAVVYGKLGDATVACCDARRMTDVVMHLWKQADCDICLGEYDIPEAWYADV